MKPNPSTPFVNGAVVSTGNPMPVSGTVVVDESTLATQTTLAAVLSKLIAAPATEATLGSILTAIQAQRAETLWTDDTLAYFVRVDANGAISWKDISGTTSAAPGTGARPVSGPSAVIDKSSYQATTAATGYSIGDLLDHIIITDPASGVVIGHFWINTTTELKLASSPSSANITPLSPLPTGAATSANQATASASLGNIDTSTAAVNTVIGAKADTLYTGGVGSWSIVALLKGLYAQLIAATPAGGNRIGKVGADADIVGGSFTRPADTTAYASGDLIANNTTAGSVTPISITASLANDGKVIIPRVRLKKSGTSLTNASFRVHLYKTLPTVTNGDNGVWLSTESTYIGAFDVTMDRGFSDGAKGTGIPVVGNFVVAEMSPGTMTIFALIEARAGYTPLSAEVFTLACEALQFS